MEQPTQPFTAISDPSVTNAFEALLFRQLQSREDLQAAITHIERNGASLDKLKLENLLVAMPLPRDVELAKGIRLSITGRL